MQVRLAGNAEKALGRGAKVTVRLGDAVISTRGRSSRAVDRHSGPGGKPIVIRSRRTLTFILDHLDGTKVKRAAVRTSGGDRASVKLAATPRALRCTRSAQLIRKLEGARDALAAHRSEGSAYLRARRTQLQEALQYENRNLRAVCPAPPTPGPPAADPDRPRPPRPPRPTSSRTPASPSRTAPRSPTPPRPARSPSTAPARATPTGRSSSGSGGSAPATTSQPGPQWTPSLAPGHWLVWLKVTDDRGAFDAVAKQIFVRGPGERTVTPAPIACPLTVEPKPVTIDVLVPSWAEPAYTATLDVPTGECPGAVFSEPTFEAVTPGNDLGEKDAWGRPLKTVTFEFTITGASSGTTTPSLTAAWH